MRKWLVVTQQWRFIIYYFTVVVGLKINPFSRVPHKVPPCPMSNITRDPRLATMYNRIILCVVTAVSFLEIVSIHCRLYAPPLSFLHSFLPFFQYGSRRSRVMQHFFAFFMLHCKLEEATCWHPAQHASKTFVNKGNKPEDNWN